MNRNHGSYQTIDRCSEKTSLHYLNPTVVRRASTKGITIHATNREMYGIEQLKVSCVFLQNEKFVGIVLMILLFSAITNGTLMQSKSLVLQENHLILCLTFISQRYFAPGRSLVISSPSTYRDV